MRGQDLGGISLDEARRISPQLVDGRARQLPAPGVLGPDQRLEPASFDRIREIDGMKIDAQSEYTIGEALWKGRDDVAAQLTRDVHGRRGIANGDRCVVVKVPIPQQ